MENSVEADAHRALQIAFSQQIFAEAKNGTLIGTAAALIFALFGFDVTSLEEETVPTFLGLQLGALCFLVLSVSISFWTFLPTLKGRTTPEHDNGQWNYTRLAKMSVTDIEKQLSHKASSRISLLQQVRVNSEIASRKHGAFATAMLPFSLGFVFTIGAVAFASMNYSM